MPLCTQLTFGLRRSHDWRCLDQRAFRDGLLTRPLCGDLLSLANNPIWWPLWPVLLIINVLLLLHQHWTLVRPSQSWLDQHCLVLGLTNFKICFLRVLDFLLGSPYRPGEEKACLYGPATTAYSMVERILVRRPCSGMAALLCHINCRNYYYSRSFWCSWSMAVLQLTIISHF